MAKILYAFSHHTNDINCCSFSPNSKVVATVSADKTARFYCLISGKECSYSPLPNQHTYSITACTFSPFGSLFVTGSQDCTVIIWNAETGEKIKTLLGHKGIVRCCTFSTSSKYLATCSSDESVCVWNIKTYELLRIFRGSEFSLTTCRFTPNDLYVVSGSYYGDIRMWDLSTGKCEKMKQAHDSGVCGVGMTGCDFSPSFGAASSTIALSGGESACFLLATCGGDNFVKLWNVYTASAHSSVCDIQLKMVLEGHNGHVQDCKFSFNGSLLVSCSSDKTAIIWEPGTGKVITKISGHTRYINTVAVSANGMYLATGSNDKTLRVWDIQNIHGDDFEPSIQLTEQGQQQNTKMTRMWTVDEVCQWLHSLGLGQYADVFRTNAIDGMELLQLDDETLSKGLGIVPLGHRNKILRDVKQLKLTESDSGIPDEFLCPITRELMSDPVLVADGFTYERSWITAWLASGKVSSPMTNTPLTNNTLIPNRSLKSAIMRYFGPAPIVFCN